VRLGLRSGRISAGLKEDRQRRGLAPPALIGLLAVLVLLVLSAPATAAPRAYAAAASAHTRLVGSLPDQAVAGRAAPPRGLPFSAFDLLLVGGTGAFVFAAAFQLRRIANHAEVL
jgi:hypothetical protein